jgi:hypothetical protein
LLVRVILCPLGCTSRSRATAFLTCAARSFATASNSVFHFEAPLARVELVALGARLSPLEQGSRRSSNSANYSISQRLANSRSSSASGLMRWDLSPAKLETRTRRTEVSTSSSGQGTAFRSCAVQAKHHRDPERKEGPSAVRDFAGVLSGHPINMGLLVTNTSFAADAKWFAHHKAPLLQLRDFSDLRWWLAGNFDDAAEWREKASRYVRAWWCP